MSHFKILIQHYLRCLLRIAVTASSALTRLSDYIPLLHVIYECMRGTYFSLPRHCPQRQLLKKNLWIIPLEQLALVMRWEERKRKGKARHSTIDSGGIERLEGRQKNVSACACDPAHCRLSLCPVNWNTKQSRVDEGAVLRRRREVWGGRAAVCLQQPSLLAGNWLGEPASETDTLSLVKWTVTLHFSTSWQHRIGRFEPCDVTLIEFCFSPPWL